MKKANIAFSHFLEYFPEVELPVTLTDESARDFSRHNEPLPPAVIEQHLLPMEAEVDEMTEFVPCFRIPETYGFHAIVYWRADLMKYQYALATFTKKGEFIDRKVIAGTISDGQALMSSVAVIEDDWEILILSGKTRADTSASYDAATSKARKLEMMPDGRIIDLN